MHTGMQCALGMPHAGAPRGMCNTNIFGMPCGHKAYTAGYSDTAVYLLLYEYSSHPLRSQPHVLGSACIFAQLCSAEAAGTPPLHKPVITHSDMGLSSTAKPAATPSLIRRCSLGPYQVACFCIQDDGVPSPHKCAIDAQF